LYFKENRNEYYALLHQTRTEGIWVEWLRFFLNGVVFVSEQAAEKISEINKLFKEIDEKVSALGRQRFSIGDALEYMKRVPQVTVISLSKALNISAPTARSALNSLCEAEIVEEITNKQRNKTYLFRKYMDILDV
jgi:Fic family protein